MKCDTGRPEMYFPSICVQAHPGPWFPGLGVLTIPPRVLTIPPQPLVLTIDPTLAPGSDHLCHCPLFPVVCVTIDPNLWGLTIFFPTSPRELDADSSVDPESEVELEVCLLFGAEERWWW